MLLRQNYSKNTPFVRRAGLKKLAAALLLMLATLMMPITAAKADQRDPRLDVLFDALQRTADSRAANQLTKEIWDRWIAYDDGKAFRLMQNGIGLMNKGELNNAEKIFSQIVTSYPDYAEAWNKRATVRFMQGDESGSRRDIARVIDLEPRHFGALTGLGMIHIRSGDLQAALQSYEAAIHFNPHLVYAKQMIYELATKLKGQSL
ncbi:MAG: tetratricopeptide repeat protein [Bacteroidetes bacterium]|jgi:tetratricopeptide (TPR) repeat protein|nr:tetratricopeptide repeat protein [Bacteroidota bacterium]